jgi:hypothetical protein
MPHWALTVLRCRLSRAGEEVWGSTSQSEQQGQRPGDETIHLGGSQTLQDLPRSYFGKLGPAASQDHSAGPSYTHLKGLTVPHMREVMGQEDLPRTVGAAGKEHSHTVSPGDPRFNHTQE